MKTLSAREYLGQLQELDTNINQDLERLDDMKTNAAVQAVLIILLKECRQVRQVTVYARQSQTMLLSMMKSMLKLTAFVMLRI